MDGKWSIEETKRLFALVEEAHANGEAIASVFNLVAQESKKTVNSVRNYYYSQLRTFEMLPSVAKQLGIKVVGAKRESFALFSASEIDELLRKVLLGKANGKSVRAVIAELSNGDAKKALRLQNKYRSTVACHKSRVNAVMATLKKEGVTYFDPYLKRVVTGGEEDDNLARLARYIGELDSDRMVDVVKLLLSK